MKTVTVNHKNITRQWYVIDATDMALGRLASETASLLMGKHKVAYAPNQDHGDYIIVINAAKVKLTGRKAETKSYFRHSQYPGGEKFRSFKEQMALDPTRVITHAVKGMLPKNSRGRAIIKKLNVYAGADHPHAAQKPEPVPERAHA